MSEENSLNAVELATELTIAWLGNQNNRVSAEDVPAFLRTMHATVNELATGSTAGGEAGDAAPGDTVTLELTIALENGWHVYTMNQSAATLALARRLGW